jgi:hypothetical protein
MAFKMTEEEYEKIKKGLYGPPNPPAPKPPAPTPPKAKKGPPKSKKRYNPFKDGSTPTSRSYGTGP